MTENIVTPQPVSQPVPPRYALRRGLGVWEVVFDGERVVVREDTGLLYVAYLLTMQPPGEPIHGLALSVRASALYRPVKRVSEVFDPVTGVEVPLGLETELQQGSLAFEEAEALWALRRQQCELEAMVDDRRHIEPVRAEAERELEAIYRYQKTSQARTVSVAQKTVRAVRMAIHRFHQDLAQALDATGAPHPVLRALAAHVESHVIIPSSRCCARGGWGSCGGAAGSFVYEPPMEVSWRV